MTKIMVMMQGGLGNQCFIYATARALAIRTGAEIMFDGSYFQEDKVYRRSFALEPFRCSVGEIVERAKPIRLLRRARYALLRDRLKRIGNYCCDMRPFRYRPLPEDWCGVLTLDGYWQSEKYFYDVREQILANFILRDAAWLKEDFVANQIAAVENSIFLHVRSYKEVPGKEGGECALRMADYYQNALARLQGEIGGGTVFVFSDDIEWTKAQFLKNWRERFSRFDFKAVDGKSSQLRDFTLMRMCRHGIVADSSFSWWAGWLGEQERMQKGEKSLRIRVNRRVMNDDFWPERWMVVDG